MGIVVKRQEPQHVKAGEVVSAKTFNMLVDSIRELTHKIHDLENRLNASGLTFMEVDTSMTRYDQGAQGHEMVFDPLATTNADMFAAGNHLLNRVTDSQGFPYLQNERHATLFLRACSRRLIIPGVVIHLAVLDEDLEQGSFAEAILWEDDLSDPGTLKESDPVITVNVFDWLMAEGAEAIPAETKVIVFGHQNSKRLYLLAAQCE